MVGIRHRIAECDATSSEHDDAARQAIARALRDLAPGHTAVRIWGRLDGATPGQAQEGNAWAASPEDIADLVLDLIKARPDLRIGS